MSRASMPTSVTITTRATLTTRAVTPSAPLWSRPHISILPYLLLPPLLASLLLVSTAPQPALGRPLQPARAPLLGGQPFLVLWGLQASCPGTLPDPATFGMERGGRVALFYEGGLGRYPYLAPGQEGLGHYSPSLAPVEGGLPQHTRLDAHLQKVAEDLVAALPAQRYLGLGVLRWAEWAPQWARNRGGGAVYQQASRDMLRAFFPNWTPEELERWSKVDFEAAAQSVLAETLREVRRLRPKALWGVAQLPGCYNADPALAPPPGAANYTGRCPDDEMALNNELQWLWRRSSALYPLLVLDKLQGGTSRTTLYTSNQIKEALRVSSLGRMAFDIPVFPLVKIVYSSTNTFLSQADLVNTIGESAALGAAGVIIWDREDMETERACTDLAQFVRQLLGPYSANITTATRLCSASLCQGRGRCVRQDLGSSAYLHLPAPPPSSQAANRSTVRLNMAAAGGTTGPPEEDEPDPAEVWKKDFQCQWFVASDGAISDQRSPKDAASGGDTGTGKAGDRPGPTGAPGREAGDSVATVTDGPQAWVETAAGRSARQACSPGLALALALLAGGPSLAP